MQGVAGRDLLCLGPKHFSIAQDNIPDGSAAVGDVLEASCMVEKFPPI